MENSLRYAAGKWRPIAEAPGGDDVFLLVQRQSTHGKLYNPEVMRAPLVKYFDEIVRFAVINLPEADHVG
jgi:hypothetical protein